MLLDRSLKLLASAAASSAAQQQDKAQQPTTIATVPTVSFEEEDEEDNGMVRDDVDDDDDDIVIIRTKTPAPAQHAKGGSNICIECSMPSRHMCRKCGTCVCSVCCSEERRLENIWWCDTCFTTQSVTNQKLIRDRNFSSDNE